MNSFMFLTHEPDVRPFEAGKVIFEDGEAHDELMYAVVEGEVEIIRDDVVIETIKKGGIFGEMALLDNQPRSAWAVAKTDCQLAAISAKRFTEIVAQKPFFALDLMTLLAERIRRGGSS